ncbi:hypothetical protein JCM9957A_04630 [Kineosporia succinea]
MGTIGDLLFDRYDWDGVRVHPFFPKMHVNSTVPGLAPFAVLVLFSSAHETAGLTDESLVHLHVSAEPAIKTSRRPVVATLAWPGAR